MWGNLAASLFGKDGKERTQTQLPNSATSNTLSTSTTATAATSTSSTSSGMALTSGLPSAAMANRQSEGLAAIISDPSSSLNQKRRSLLIAGVDIQNQTMISTLGTVNKALDYLSSKIMSRSESELLLNEYTEILKYLLDHSTVLKPEIDKFVRHFEGTTNEMERALDEIFEISNVMRT